MIPPIVGVVTLCVWGITCTVSFFVLPFWWAVTALILNAAAIPVLSMPVYAPFRKYFCKNSLKWGLFVSGCIEGVVCFILILVMQKRLTAPGTFGFFVVGECILGHLHSAFRKVPGSIDELEMWELLGFLTSLGLLLPLTFFI